MSDDRPALAAVPGLAKIPGPPARRTPNPAANDPRNAGANSQPSAHQTAADDPQNNDNPRDADTPREKPRRASRPTVSTAAGQASAAHATSFTTTVALRDALRERVRQDGGTTADTVFRAITTHADALRDLVAAEKPPANSGGVASLFPHPTQARRSNAEPRIAVPLRAASGNFEVLDQLVTTSGADNRSQLITAVLRAELT